MSETVLIFTPTQPEREKDPFLEACRARAREIQCELAKKMGVQGFVTTKTPLGAAYQQGLDFALNHQFDRVLVIEDDVLPPPDIADQFLSWALPVVCSRLPLRPAATKLGVVNWLPWVGAWGSNTEAFRSWRQLDADELEQRLVNVDMVANPFMYNPAILRERQITFKGDKDWDLQFAIDCRRKGVSVWCIPSLKSQHYCVQTHEVYR